MELLQSSLPTNSAFHAHKSQQDSALGDSNISFGDGTRELAPRRQIVSQSQMDSALTDVAGSSNKIPKQNRAQKPKLGN